MIEFYLMIIAIVVVITILGLFLFFRHKMRQISPAHGGDDEAYVCSKLSDTLIDPTSPKEGGKT